SRKGVDGPGRNEGVVPDSHLAGIPVGEVVDVGAAARKERGLVGLPERDGPERAPSALVAEVSGVFGVRGAEGDETTDVCKRPARVRMAPEGDLEVSDRLAGQDHGEAGSA